LSGLPNRETTPRNWSWLAPKLWLPSSGTKGNVVLFPRWIVCRSEFTLTREEICSKILSKGECFSYLYTLAQSGAIEVDPEVTFIYRI
jgi:hypothetical protein